MTLQDIFDQLTYGELSQVFIGEGGEAIDAIPESKRKAVLAHVTLGLTELHKRFLLKEGTLTIGLIEGRQSYVLDAKYAQSNTRSKEPVKYIQDLAAPFENDLLKVERVYDDKGCELALNIIDDPCAVRTPHYKGLLLPDALKSETLKVVYRANHPPIKDYLATAAPAQVEINLPVSHLEALLLYIASRVHNPIGLSGEFHEGNNYAAKFEASCARIERLNYRVDTQGMNTHLERNGWV